MPKLGEWSNNRHALNIINGATISDRRLKTGNSGSRVYSEEN
jgi:hypothetical protein